MPAGMPEVANATTSREVKSGFMNESLWYSLGQGMSFKYFSALSTRRPNFALISLLTTDTKPTPLAHLMGHYIRHIDISKRGIVGAYRRGRDKSR